MYYQLKSLVLRVRISDEADKLATLYTYEWGKVTALVPGAKKIKAKLSAATEPVSETELMVYVASPTARPTVTGAKIIDSFASLRYDWRRFALAQYCAEITEVLTPFNSENARKYELLARTWKLLEAAQHPWRIFAAFTLRFLKYSGYSFTDYLKKSGHPIPPKEMQAIQKMATLSGDDVDKELDIEENLEKDIQRRQDSYINLYLPRPLSTREFWQMIGHHTNKNNEGKRQ
jgi:DNA repair protein RecO (recombination protein O)